MACESCKVVVKEALEELEISPVKVELGEIETKEDISHMVINPPITKAAPYHDPNEADQDFHDMWN